MRVAIIGTNGMLSSALANHFYNITGNEVDVFGRSAPRNYKYSSFFQLDLIKDEIDYFCLSSYDVIIYASGAGTKTSSDSDASLMYVINVFKPIEITQKLKKIGFQGIYISFGSYMEIGINDDDSKFFSEDDVVCSSLKLFDDYALSKRLYGRYMRDFSASFCSWHFILPNVFSLEDFKPGTRLIPYVLQYVQNVKKKIACEEPEFSAGTQIRQFIFLNDIMVALQKAIDKKIPSGIYNVGGGESYSIRTLIEKIFTFYNVDCKDCFFGKSVRRDGEVKSLRISGKKLYEAIEYLPTSTIDVILGEI